MFMSFPSGLGTEGKHANRCRDFAAGRGSWQVLGTGEATRDCRQLWLRPLGERPEERRAPGGDRGARGGGPLEASVAAESRVSDMNFWTHAAGMEVLRTVPAGAGAATSKRGASLGGLLLATGKPGGGRWADGTWPGKGSAILSI